MKRRSMMSQHSGLSPQQPDSPHFDNNQIEALSSEHILSSRPYVSRQNSAPSPMMPAAPSPVLGSSTVAYGPDHMLAVYAARAKANQASLNIVPTPGPVPAPKPALSSIRYLPSGATTPTGEMPPPPPPVKMKSYVHLNNGTVSPETMGVPESVSMPSSGSGSGSGSGSRATLGLRIPSFKDTKRGNAGISGVSNAASDGSWGEDDDSHAK